MKKCNLCFEKHLGAAYVLLHEVRNGHSENKIFLIGHLTQAEEEGDRGDVIRDIRHMVQDGRLDEAARILDMVIYEEVGE